MKEYFQKIGRSLMLPIAILPAASILVGVGNWLASAKVGFVSQFMIIGGNAILGVLPYLFAIGLALGMTKKRDGAAALAGFVALTIPINVLAPNNIALLLNQSVDKINPAFLAIQNNVLIGIIAGLIAAFMFDKFSEVKLPQAIAFFSGKRLVPILTAIVMLMISLILLVIWPTIFGWLVSFGKMVVNLGPIGAGLYGFFNRLLIPTGLHHALNSVFWFNVAGINDIFNFLHSTGVKGITGQYQAGFFPIMMFGLPAGAFAIYKNARKEQKKRIGSLMLASGFASFFTGVTEPLEFSFMFVAWPLYVVHAIFTGISMYVAALFHWTNGFAFSAGLVDYVVDYQLPMANKPYMLLVLGLIIAFVYYFVFSFMIKKFNLLTPGRDPKEDNIEIQQNVNESIIGNDKYQVLAQNILKVIGKGNIDNAFDELTEMTHCTTRLRYKFKDTDSIDVDKLKQVVGVAGVNVLDKKQMHIVIGPDVEFVHQNIEKIRNKELFVKTDELALNMEDKSKKTTNSDEMLNLVAVSAGLLKDLSQVSDKTFASKAVGDGYAILPETKEVVSPVDGEVTFIFKTKHALGITTKNGVEILVHMGINTVELNGKPFDIKVVKGQKVFSGDTLATMDLKAVKDANKETDIMVVITNKKGTIDLKQKNNIVKIGEKIGQFSL